MKNLENFFNSKKGKMVAWLLILLVAVLAVVLIIGFKLTNKPIETSLNNERIENSGETEIEIPDSGESFHKNETNPEDLLKPYPKLSGDSYEIDPKSKTISFDPNMNISSFSLSDNPDGPTKDDYWHDLNGEKETEIFDFEIHKKYVHYMAYTSAPVDYHIRNGEYGVIYTTATTVTLRVQITSGGIPNSVYFPFGSNVNSNWVWYSGTHEGNNIWSCTINLANHELGTASSWECHIYANGSEYIGTKFWIGWDETPPTISNISPNPCYTTDGKVTISCTVTDNHAVKEVRFPTWSDYQPSGASSYQDDIVWYEGTNKGNNVWSVTIDLSKHTPGKAGNHFNIHIYAYDYISSRGITTLGAYWRTKLTIPSIKGSYTYNGSSQTAQLNYFDSGKMNISNNTRTAAGSQNVSVSLKDTNYYQWSDGTTGAKSISWTIAKANAAAQTLSNTTATYDGGRKYIGRSGGTSGLTKQYAYRTWNGSSYGSWSSWGTTEGYYSDINVGKWEIKERTVGNDNYNTSAESNVATLTINKANMATPTVSIDTDGKVTWGAVTGATGYEISFDNKTWTSASSGGKSVDKTSTRNENSLCTSSVNE